MTLVILGEVLVAGRHTGKSLASSSWRKRWPNPRVSGVELSSTPPGKNCVTIASTEAKVLPDKCDNDEFTAMN